MSIIRLGLLLFFLASFSFIEGESEDEFSSTNNESNHTDETCQEGYCDRITFQNSNTTQVKKTTVLNSLPQETQTYGISMDITWELSNPSCPVDVPCSSLPAECISCLFNFTCIYGQPWNVTCHAIQKCEGSREFVRSMTCQYCYQTRNEDHTCSPLAHCNTIDNPVQKYRSNCTVKSHVLCLGQRKFLKNIRCNWTSGYRWSTTLILSITLGGFGADRFYLGHWQEGIGKLFSFGGAGVWTLIDVILVAVGYLKPADGSVYI